MKKSKLFIGAVAIAFSLNAHAQDQYLTIGQTPKQIQAYVSKNFPQNKIVTVKKDIDFPGVEYEVKLSDNVDLEFDKNYVIKSIESKTSLPESVVPQNIRSYVTTNYPNTLIVEWKKRYKGQKIELNNDIELYFDANSKFVREDR